MAEKYPDFIKSTGYGTGEGLCGWNCYHSFAPFVPGLSTPNYTDEELKKLNEQENTPVEYNGRQYTRYEATQRQRSLERTLHAKNQTVELLKQGGASEEDIQIAEVQYRKTSHEYAQFSKAMGLPQQRQRVQLKNIGNSLTYDKNNGKIELQRAKSDKRTDIRPINDKRFEQLTIEARKNGAIIVRGGEEVEKHLDAMNADASIIGDVIFFRNEVCVSEVIEETHHFMQNINKMNDDKSEPLRTYLNEIEAKQYLLKNARKFNIPRSETELTRKHLEYYQKLLKELRKGKL